MIEKRNEEKKYLGVGETRGNFKREYYGWERKQQRYKKDIRIERDREEERMSLVYLNLSHFPQFFIY